MEFKNVIDLAPHSGIQQELERVKGQLRLLQRIAKIGLWEWRPSNNHLFWSEETYEIMGIAKHNFDGHLQTYLSMIPEVDMPKVEEAIQAVIAGHAPPDFEHRITRPDGEVRNVYLRCISVPNKEGDLLVTGLIEDITESKNKDEALNNVSRRLTTIIESIAHGFLSVDQSWRINYLNGAAEIILQRSREEVNGKVLWEECNYLIGTEYERQFRYAMAQQASVSFEALYTRLNIWCEVHVFPSEDGLTIYFQNITERRNSQQALRESEERFKIIGKATTDIVWDWNLESDYLWWNENAKQSLGITDLEMQSADSWTSRIHPQDKDHVLQSISTSIEGTAEHWQSEYRLRLTDGAYAYFYDRGYLIRNDQGKAVRMVGAALDLTERRKSEAKIRDQAALLDKARDAFVVRGLDQRIQFWNKGAEQLYGWSANEAVGRSVERLLYRDSVAFEEATRKLFNTGEWTGELVDKHKNGSSLVVESHWTLLQDENGNPHAIFSVNRDISERKEAEKKIRQLAFHDALTGLPNQANLLEYLHQLNKQPNHNYSSAILLVDLDNFKMLNDTFGHEKGDQLLRQTAERLKSVVRQSDMIARFGGDEFIIVLNQLAGNIEDASTQASNVAKKIISLIGIPFELEGMGTFHSTPSIGIAVFTAAEASFGNLLKQTDFAMYQAKAGGRNTYRFFDPQMQAEVEARTRLEADLRKAIHSDQLVMYFQPQVHSSGRIVGVETLLRWRHPIRGMVPPSEFIPVAEASGLILPIGRRTLEKTCALLKRWSSDPNFSDLSIAINVSASQVHHPDFNNIIIETIKQEGAPPRLLKLEITETVLLNNIEDIISKMIALRSHGIQFSIDDFGTGYSSLSYLRRLPLSQLKIDKSFVADVNCDPHDATIVRSIIQLGNNLGLEVIAEGVETDKQHRFLIENGCHYYQGYFFGRPMPIEEIEALILKSS